MINLKKKSNDTIFAFYFLSLFGKLKLYAFTKLKITCLLLVWEHRWHNYLLAIFSLSSLILYYVVKSSWACTQSLLYDAFLEYVGTMKNNLSYKVPIRSNIEFLKCKTYTYFWIHHQESPMILFYKKPYYR